MDKSAKHRLFFGLEIPALVKQRLLSAQQPIAGARWQRTDQLHLTLAFLGNVQEQQLPDICEAARNLPVKPFPLTVSGLGCFGDPDHPRNLWAGVHPVDELAGLHRALIQRLASLGFGQEKRAFRPHITLSRFGKEAGSVRQLLQKQQPFDAGTVLVDRFALFDSVTREQGSFYQIIDRFSLVGPE